jgi:aminoglycoside phosphotransferase (APT) family kinase protein
MRIRKRQNQAPKSRGGRKMNASIRAVPAFKFENDLEPGIAAVLDRRLAERAKPAYKPKTDADTSATLAAYFGKIAPSSRVANLKRMGGGASKEQFVFDLEGGDLAGRYILRMDPRGTAVETDRRREYEALNAFAGIVPAPKAFWLDADGSELGQPAAIMGFIAGVTKPAAPQSTRVSGLGTALGARLRPLLGPQFISHLVAMHKLEYNAINLPSYQIPNTDPSQAASWQANWWSRVWIEDKVASLPVAALVRTWLLENLPPATDLVFVHGDYRTGNYLFDEESGKITAILDWELAHIGDYHEDLGWVLQRIFGASEDGKFYVSGLFERQEFLDLYEQASGRRVDPKALHFYEVLAAFKCLALCLGTSVQVASNAHNHQDALLTWLAAAGHIFHAELCTLLEKDLAA